MIITYIVTISPVIPIELMNMLVHSMNMQTNKNFDVIFYNQTKYDEDELIGSLFKIPLFRYSFHSIDKEFFFGDYPLWDLYKFHQFLLDNNLLADYFMSLHMEEFLDSDYTDKILEVLTCNQFDVLMGNLHSTSLLYKDTNDILETLNLTDFDLAIEKLCDKQIHKWSLQNKKWFLTRHPIANLKKSQMLGYRKTLSQTAEGYTQLDKYLFEDIYAMSTNFAKRNSWFDSPHQLYFEDIHINWGLTSLVKKLTAFPVYLNSSKVYHMIHGKYYYQVENEEFANRILKLVSANPVVLSLQKAIEMYRNSNMTAGEALRYSRRNGTVKQNIEFHKENLKNTMVKK